jgi:hypothetical protein
VANLDILDLRARRPQSINRLLESPTNLIVEQIAEESARHAKAEVARGPGLNGFGSRSAEQGAIDDGRVVDARG